EDQPMQLRTGRTSAANVPGVRSASDGAVDNVKRIGNGIEHDPRAAENAGTLADRPGRALFFAVDLKGLLALSIDLPLAFVQNIRHPALQPHSLPLHR